MSHAKEGRGGQPSLSINASYYPFPCYYSVIVDENCRVPFPIHHPVEGACKNNDRSFNPQPSGDSLEMGMELVTIYDPCGSVS